MASRPPAAPSSRRNRRRRSSGRKAQPLGFPHVAAYFQRSHAGTLLVAEPALASRRYGQPAARRGDGAEPGAAALRGDDPPLRRRRDLRQDRRERPRPGRLHHPADEPAGGELDGTAVPDRRGAACQRRTDHGGAAVLRLRASGPERPAAGRDQRQAHSEPDHARRRGSGAGNGLPFPPAARVLRHSGGPPVCGPGVREPLSAEGPVRPGGRRAIFARPTSGATTTGSYRSFCRKWLTNTGAAYRWSTGMSKNPCSWWEWKSIPSTRSAPACVIRFAMSLALIATRGWSFRS